MQPKQSEGARADKIGGSSSSGKIAGRPPISTVLKLAFVLGALWILLSGFFIPLILSLGFISVAFTIYLAYRMNILDDEGVPDHILGPTLAYLPWLAWEVVKANIDVAKRVLAPTPNISPMLFDTPATQGNDLGLAIYANSITLTPGTISVDLEPGMIRVHALSTAGAEDVLEGEMDRRCSALIGDTTNPAKTK